MTKPPLCQDYGEYLALQAEESFNNAYTGVKQIATPMKIPDTFGPYSIFT